MRKKKIFIGLLATVSLVASPTIAFADSNHAPVDWGGGSGAKGASNPGLELGLNALQYRFWKKHVEGGSKSGPGQVVAWKKSLDTQNKEAWNAVGAGAGKTTYTSPVKEEITCYKVTGTKKDDQTGKTTYYFSKNIIQKREKQGWADKNKANTLCPSLENITIPGKGKVTKPSKLVSAAYSKDVYEKGPSTTGKSETMPKSDPRCGTGIDGLNKEAKEKPLNSEPKNASIPNKDDHVTNGSNFKGGCVYMVPGFTGQASKLTSEGGMHCVRGWNIGKQLEGKNAGKIEAETMAGTEWKDSKIKGVVENMVKTKYGQNPPSWDNCAEDDLKLDMNGYLKANKKEILPTGIMGRYRNKIYVYTSDPTIDIKSWAGDGSPEGVSIVADNPNSEPTIIPVELQQGCQTKYLKDKYTPTEARSRDVDAETMTHYSIGENVPDRLVDVYIANDPNKGKNTNQRVPLSYNMTDCMYKPNVVRKDYSYRCGTDKKDPKINKTETNPSVRKESVDNIDKPYSDAKTLFEEKEATVVSETSNGTEKETPLGENKNSKEQPDRLTITRSSKPTYLRWDRPTIVVDKTMGKGNGKEEPIGPKPGSVRIDKSLTLTERYTPEHAKTLRNGTPFVDTPESKNLVTEKSTPEELHFKNELTKRTGSNFLPNYVSPTTKSSGSSLPGEAAKISDEGYKVSSLEKADQLDFRTFSSQNGNVNKNMTISGTGSGYPEIKNQSPRLMTGKNASTMGDGTLSLTEPSKDGKDFRSLDKFFNSYDNGYARPAVGLGTVWYSEKNLPHKVSEAVNISGKFGVETMELLPPTFDGMNNLKIKFQQTTRTVDTTLQCISAPTTVISLKPSS